MDGRGLTEGGRELLGVGGRDPGGIERTCPIADLQRARERRLHRNLLVEQHPDEQGEWFVGEERVGGLVAGDVKSHGSMFPPSASPPWERMGG